MRLFFIEEENVMNARVHSVETFGQFEVIETDSVILFDVPRKRLKVNSALGEMYWIEGIGSTIHPFHSIMSGLLNSTQNYSLLCYHEGETCKK